MQKNRAKWICGLVMVAALFISSCTTNPATGKKQLNLVGDRQLKQMGLQYHQQLVKQEGLYPNKTLQSYVTEVGQRVAKWGELKDVTYRFYVVNGEDMNAFALPDGRIYITHTLLGFTNSEAELASIMAHEVAHVTARHVVDRYNQGVLANIGGMIAAASIGGNVQNANQLIGLGQQIAMSGFSRAAEAEADRLGIRYLERAGYDTTEMADVFETLFRYQAFLQKTGQGGGVGIPFLSTHPSSESRAETTEALARQYNNGDQVKNRKRHLSLLNGMIFGNEYDVSAPEINIMIANEGQSSRQMSKYMELTEHPYEEFLLLNGLLPGDPLIAEQGYKILAKRQN